MKSYFIFYFIFVISRSSLVRKLNSSATSSTKEVSALYSEKDNTLIYNDKVYRLKDSASGEHHEVDISELPTDYIIWNSFIIMLLTCFAGLMSGLTVGYLSIDEMVLEIKVIGGTDEEKSQGLIVQDVLHDKHRLLVTLLLSNAFAMEALPIFINRLLPEWAAIIISTTLVLFLGEVIPQAYATGVNQMKVACMCANMTKNLMWVLYPLNYPLGLMLDHVLGKHSRNRLLNSDLRTLIELHTYTSLKKHELIHESDDKTAKNNNISINNAVQNAKGKNIELQVIPDTVNSLDEYNSQVNTLKDDKLSYIKGNELHSTDFVKKDLGLNDEQANLMVSAIEMKDKNAIELMIPINNTFITSYDEKIDNIRLSLILEKGYSRIPVYSGSDSNNIIGLVRIKQLIGIDFTNNKSMRQHGIQLKKPLCISPRTSLLELLREFRKGKSHMAFISESPKDLSRKLDISCGISKGDVKDIKSNTQVLGIVTIEDVIEKMINSEIYDEDDYDDMKKENKLGVKNKTVTKNISKEFIKENSSKLNSLINESLTKKSFINHYLTNDFQISPDQDYGKKLLN